MIFNISIKSNKNVAMMRKRDDDEEESVDSFV